MDGLTQLLTTGKVNVEVAVTVDNATLTKAAVAIIAIVIIGIFINKAVNKYA